MFVSFTIETAITRLAGSGKSAFPAVFTSDQRVQRVNEVLDRFYEQGTWRDVFTTLSDLTTTAGVLSLPSGQQKLEALSGNKSTCDCGCKIPIKSKQWAFEPGGPGLLRDWSKYCIATVAIDMGDVGGVRKYQLTGSTDHLDSLLLKGLVRKRYVWTTDTTTVVIPDSFQALKIGVLALNAEDELAFDQYDALMGRALQILNGNLDEFHSVEELGTMQIDAFVGAGSIPNLL